MRLYSLKIFFLLFLILITSRLFYWQVIKADELSVYAENQYYDNTQIQAVRGNIFFSDSSMLASTKPVFLLYGMPKSLNASEKTELVGVLLPILLEVEKSQDAEINLEERENTLKEELKQKLDKDLYWVMLEKGLDIEVKQKIDKLQLKGIGFEQNTARFYPEGSSSAHLLGFVGAGDKSESTGYGGIEGFFDGELKGISGSARHERDALGLPILTGNFFSTEAKNGNDLILNVDRTIQFIAEQSIKKGIEKYGAKAASVIVMDPKTGAILAMASYPNYDPGNYRLFPKEYFKNPIVADQYEPGSTFKVLVMAAGVNESVVKADTECDICSGPLQVGGFSIRTWDNKYTDGITMTDTIIHSDNTGMVYVARKLGLDKFYQYLDDFGFGKPTNIDLQGEAAPGLRDKDEWREIDLATTSFGQGIAVTPIQMIKAVSSIANGGYLIEPQIVRSIRDNKGLHEIKPKVIKRVLTDQTTKVVTEMMVKAVDEGEARVFKPKGFKIAGKTGTAQIPVAGHYDPNKTIASFVGFAPADDPKFIILVRYDQPTSSIYGSETAAPTFFEIAKELYLYYRIATPQ